jgi:anion-transporting  ArsA/GET3 family ATPase
MAKKKVNIDQQIENVISNIEKDREVTLELLSDVMQYISKDQHKHAEVGHVTAKYIESLQRSNEQLVKMTAIMLKREDSQFGSFSDEEKESIYDSLRDQK